MGRRVIKQAVREARIEKNASCHALHHSFATHLLERGMDIHAMCEQLGHKEVRTTRIHAQVLNRGGSAELSPLSGVLSRE